MPKERLGYDSSDRGWNRCGDDAEIDAPEDIGLKCSYCMKREKKRGEREIEREREGGKQGNEKEGKAQTVYEWLRSTGLVKTR